MKHKHTNTQFEATQKHLSSSKKKKVNISVAKENNLKNKSLLAHGHKRDANLVLQKESPVFDHPTSP